MNNSLDSRPTHSWNQLVSRRGGPTCVHESLRSRETLQSCLRLLSRLVPAVQLHPLQGGFRPGLSSIRERKKKAFLDAQKAFDTVWHAGLLPKLHNKGIRAVADPGNRKGGSKVSSAKREELNPREARKIWGYAHFRCSKTRENPILSQGKSHFRLRGTAREQSTS